MPLGDHAKNTPDLGRPPFRYESSFRMSRSCRRHRLRWPVSSSSPVHVNSARQSTSDSMSVRPTSMSSTESWLVEKEARVKFPRSSPPATHGLKSDLQWRLDTAPLNPALRAFGDVMLGQTAEAGGSNNTVRFQRRIDPCVRADPERTGPRDVVIVAPQS